MVLLLLLLLLMKHETAKLNEETHWKHSTLKVGRCLLWQAIFGDAQMHCALMWKIAFLFRLFLDLHSIYVMCYDSNRFVFLVNIKYRRIMFAYVQSSWRYSTQQTNFQAYLMHLILTILFYSMNRTSWLRVFYIFQKEAHNSYKRIMNRSFFSLTEMSIASEEVKNCLFRLWIE